MGESKSVHDHRVKKTPKDEGRSEKTKTCIKVITGNSYLATHLLIFTPAIMHSIIMCAFFYKLDWLYFTAEKQLSWF